MIEILARLLPKFYSAQYYYHYLQVGCWPSCFVDVEM